MKIGIMCHSSCGGSARIALNSASEIAKRGHEVHLFTRTPAYMPLKNRERISCHTLHKDRSRTEHPARLRTRWSKRELDGMAEMIIDVCERPGLDIIHIHYALPFIFIAQSVRQRLQEKAPSVVLTLHGTDVNCLKGDTGDASMFLQALGCCDAVTTVSISHARMFTRLSRLDTGPEVIPNFVDLSIFNPSHRVAAEKSPVILHVSNFREVKNPCGVVDIFERLIKEFKAALWFVGDGEEMGRVKELVKERGLKKDVRFFGLLHDVHDVVKNADLLVITSVYESFCLAALEAMACGVPVLAPHVGGLPEVVVHGRTGYLYRADDYGEAADYASRLLSQRELYLQTSMNAVKRAQTFDQEKIVSIYERLYYRVRGNAEHRP